MITPGPVRRTTLVALMVGIVLITGCAGSVSPSGSGPQPSASGTPAVVGPSPSAFSPTPTSTPTGIPTEPSTALSPPPTASTAPSPAGSPLAATWTELSPSGDVPAAREDHTWTVDASGRYAYLFGGRFGGEVYRDLWRYDLESDAWEELAPEGDGPRLRFGHTGTWVEGVGLVIWSGQTGSSFYDDIWAFDPEEGSWRELPGAGERPDARYGSCAALGNDGRLWVSHGFTSDGRFDDTRAYDFAAGRWMDETPASEKPIQRCLHDCLWTPEGRLLLYAGQTNGDSWLTDLWSLVPGGGETPTAWTGLGAQAPPGRNLYALARQQEQALIFGGIGPGGDRLDDLWALSFAELSFRSVDVTGAGPSARSGATMIDDRTRDRVLLFGGRTTDAALADIWQLDLRA